MYRLFYSHKNLLNWITAEEVEKTVNGDLKNYIRNFSFNIFTSFVFIVIGYITNNYLAYLLAAVFLTGPFVLYTVSKTIDYHSVDLKERKIDEIEDLALRTWKYFEDNLCEEYNFLIPDNYQDNREEKLDMRTSPTAIGFSLSSVVCAYELEFIDEEKAINFRILLYRLCKIGRI